MWSVNNRLVLSSGSNGGFFKNRDSAILRFNVRGTTFPDTIYEIDGAPNTAPGSYLFRSKTPNKVIIDWGDGSSETVDFQFAGVDDYVFYMTHLDMPKGSFTQTIPYHQYTDGAGGDVHNALPEHVVSFRFDKPDEIYNISIQHVRIYGIFPSDIGRLSGLESLTLTFTYQITDFPIQFGESTSIKNLNLRNIGSVMEEAIPIEFFSLPLESLGVSESVVLTDVTSSNFDKINLLKDTLTNFSALGCAIFTLPTEITECINLTSLNISGNRYTEVPPEVNSLVNLETLIWGYINPNLTGWGDFSACTELRIINFNSNVSGTLTTDLPPWLNLLTKWKGSNCSATFGQTQERTDTWVSNMYDFVITNAPMVGTSSDPFRNMTIDLSLPPTHAHYQYTKRPSGIFQQPTGYVQGSNNGMPASPMEMIWVLTNQYNHTWSVNP